MTETQNLSERRVFLSKVSSYMAGFLQALEELALNTGGSSQLLKGFNCQSNSSLYFEVLDADESFVNCVEHHDVCI